MILSLKMALRSIRSNKMRAMLTMLGIIIGVMALVVLVSLVSGATGSVTEAVSSLGSSKSADAENAGLAQLDVDVAALTMNGDVITSCYIDSLQAKVSFGADGVITTDLTAPVQTKNELGEAYNMKLYGGAQYEWNEQAASFAAYVTGKTAADVAGIAVSEGKPADADLSATVTIAIGGFQALIAKAAK